MRSVCSWAVVLCALGAALVGHAAANDPNMALEEPKSLDEKLFLNWLTSAGGEMDGIDMGNFTNPIFSNFKLRGVKATRDIKAGDLLLSVPGNLIMSTVTALESSLSPVFHENPGLFTDDQVLLTVFVMYELQNAQSSKWWHHIKVLPTRFHTACEFTEAELRELEGSVLREEAKARQALFLDEFARLFPFLTRKYPHFFDHDKSTFTAYKYARLLVQTRAFGMHVDGRVIIGIVPMGDMLNHNPEAKVAWKYDHSTNVFRMYTEEPYLKGMQVFNNYGPRTNRRLLLDFGFVLTDNPFDFVEMPAPSSTSNTVDKQQVLQDRGLDPAKRTFPVKLGELPEDLMFAARIARATPDEITAYKRSMELAPSVTKTRMVPRFNASISIQNEIATLGWVQDVANAMLAKYPDTYEDDVELLEATMNMGRSQVSALIVRHGEKRIYKFLSEFAAVHMPLLEYYQRYLNSNTLTNSRISLAGAEYMRNVLLPLHRSMLERSFEASQKAFGGQALVHEEATALQPQA